jgi:hypothetical protein
MRNKIFGTIGILWGGGMLVSFFLRGAPLGNGAYAAGTIFGLLLGVVMLFAGIYYVRK